MRSARYPSINPVWIFVGSALVGLFQLALAYTAGVSGNVVAHNITRFGYLMTFHWSVVYVVLVPLILAAAAPVVLELVRRAQKTRNYLRLALLVGFGISFASFTAGQEVLHSLGSCSTIQPFIQWNCIGDSRAAYTGTSYHPRLHYALLIVSYSHYFLVYLFGSTAVIGTLWSFRLLGKGNLAVIRMSNEEKHLLLSQRTIVVCYLLYLVCLRSSKTGMHLETITQPVQLKGLFEFFKNADPYIEAISPGLRVTLILGLFWCAVVIVTHALAWQAEHPRRHENVLAILGPISGGLTNLGSHSRFYAGACLVAIALPPPGITALALVAVIVVGLAQVKAGISRKAGADSN